MRKTSFIYVAVVAVLAWGCAGQPKNETHENDADAAGNEAPGGTAGMNQLTEQEKADGWILLFDGRTTNGWKGYNRDDVPAAWVVEDGALTLDTTQQAPNRGDLMTSEMYENYELALEWKISEGGNSGIIYNVIESPENRTTYNTGPEMQVLDNERHKDAKIDKHRAGDLYDLIRSSSEPVHPAGEWNQVRIVQKDGKIEHWLNGVKVVETDMNSPQWAELIAGSKFKTMKDFGKSRKGHIALQDHGDKVWYRNIKLKAL